MGQGSGWQAAGEGSGRLRLPSWQLKPNIQVHRHCSPALSRSHRTLDQGRGWGPGNLHPGGQGSSGS